MRKNCYKQSEHDGTAEQDEQTLQVQKISSKIRSTGDGIRSTNEIFDGK